MGVHELPDVQAGFRKGRGTRDQIVNIRWIMEKAREFQKSIYFCLSLTREARIYNGLKTISLTSGAGKTGQPLAKE